MIFELAQDSHDAVAAMPEKHTKHRMLELLEEAVRRDIHFINCHLTACSSGVRGKFVGGSFQIGRETGACGRREELIRVRL